MGTYEYPAGSDTSGSPLAARLLEVEGIELVLIAPRFVTVRKRSEADWPAIVPAVKERLRAFLAAGEVAVLDSALDGLPDARGEVEQRIIALLDEEIRPAIAMDGGDVTYMGFEDGIVRLQLIGACGTCPSSITTLKMGIERLLVDEIPEVRGVENV